MSSEVYRKVGRGGAGNFYSPKDVEEAKAKPTTGDVEAQIHNEPHVAAAGQGPAHGGPAAAADATTDLAAPPPSSSPPAYSRAGRGGAGNFYEPPTVGDAIEREDEARRTQAAAGASFAHQQRAGGLAGRGGAGNWSTDTTGTTAAAFAAERQKKQRLEDKVRQDVEAGLAMPPKTYHQHDRDTP